MPEVVATEARAHRAKTVLVVATVASVAVVGGLYAMATGSVSSAQDQLDAATAQHAALNAESAKYADVPKVQAQVVTAQNQMYQALGGEVRWSFLLNNLSLTIPAGVSLVNFAGTVSENPPAAATVPGATTTTSDAKFVSVLGTPGIGSISYSGEALGYPQVSAFLDAQAKQAALIDPYVTSVQSGTSSGSSTSGSAANTYTFTSTATVSDKALSHRYDVKAGG
jgi:hypothetical protein